MASVKERAIAFASANWWILLLIVAGWMWLKQHDTAVKYQATAEAQLQQIQLLVHQSDSMVLQVKKRDSTISVQQKTIVAQRTVAEQAQKEAATATDKKVSDLRLSLDEHQRVMLDQVVAGYNQQLYQVALQASANLALYNTEHTKVLARDSLLANLQSFNHSLADSLTKAVKAGQPSLVQKAGKIVPWVIAGAALAFRH